MIAKTTLKAGCGLVAVFLAGLLCGAVALFLFIVWVIPLSEGWRDVESKTFVTRHIARQLDLDEAQLERVRPIVHTALDERFERRRAYVEEDIELTGRSLSGILPILREDQKKKAEAAFRRWKRGKQRFLDGEADSLPTRQEASPRLPSGNGGDLP